MPDLLVASSSVRSLGGVANGAAASAAASATPAAAATTVQSMPLMPSLSSHHLASSSSLHSIQLPQQKKATAASTTDSTSSATASPSIAPHDLLTQDVQHYILRHGASMRVGTMRITQMTKEEKEESNFTIGMQLTKRKMRGGSKPPKHTNGADANNGAAAAAATAASQRDTLKSHSAKVATIEKYNPIALLHRAIMPAPPAALPAVAATTESTNQNESESNSTALILHASSSQLTTTNGVEPPASTFLTTLPPLAHSQSKESVVSSSPTSHAVAATVSPPLSSARSSTANLHNRRTTAIRNFLAANHHTSSTASIPPAVLEYPADVIGYTGSKPKFLLDCEEYIRQEMKTMKLKENSMRDDTTDSENPPTSSSTSSSSPPPDPLRLSIYRSVFHYFLSEFPTYRSLLSRIQNEYDSYIRGLETQVAVLPELKCKVETVEERIQDAIQQCEESWGEKEEDWMEEKMKLENELTRVHEAISLLHTTHESTQSELQTLQSTYHSLLLSNTTLKSALERRDKDKILHQEEKQFEKELIQKLQNELLEQARLYQATKQEMALLKRHAQEAANMTPAEWKRMKTENTELTKELSDLSSKHASLLTDHTRITDLYSSVSGERQRNIEERMRYEAMREGSTPRPSWKRLIKHSYFLKGEKLNLSIMSSESLVDELCAHIDALKGEVDGWKMKYPSEEERKGWEERHQQQQQQQHKKGSRSTQIVAAASPSASRSHTPDRRRPSISNSTAATALPTSTPSVTTTSTTSTSTATTSSPAPPPPPPQPKHLRSLGCTPDVPQYLRTTTKAGSKVKIRILTKRETEQLIHEVWEMKLNSGGKEFVSGMEYTQMSLSSFLYIYLKAKYTFHDVIVQYGYSLHHAIESMYQYDPDCRLFLAILSGGVHESVYTDQQHMIKGLKEALQKEDRDGHKGKEIGRLPRKQVLEVLSSYFTTKTDSAIREINHALFQDDRAEVVNYELLFEENREGTQSALIELLREQHLSEIQSFNTLLVEKCAEKAQRYDLEGRLKVEQIREVIQLLDPAKTKKELDLIMKEGCEMVGGGGGAGVTVSATTSSGVSVSSSTLTSSTSSTVSSPPNELSSSSSSSLQSSGRPPSSSHEIDPTLFFSNLFRKRLVKRTGPPPGERTQTKRRTSVIASFVRSRQPSITQNGAMLIAAAAAMNAQAQAQAASSAASTATTPPTVNSHTSLHSSAAATATASPAESGRTTPTMEVQSSTTKVEGAEPSSSISHIASPLIHPSSRRDSQFNILMNGTSGSGSASSAVSSSSGTESPIVQSPNAPRPRRLGLSTEASPGGVARKLSISSIAQAMSSVPYAMKVQESQQQQQISPQQQPQLLQPPQQLSPPSVLNLPPKNSLLSVVSAVGAKQETTTPSEGNTAVSSSPPSLSPPASHDRRPSLSHRPSFGRQESVSVPFDVNTMNRINAARVIMMQREAETSDEEEDDGDDEEEDARVNEHRAALKRAFDQPTTGEDDVPTPRLTTPIPSFNDDGTSKDDDSAATARLESTTPTTVPTATTSTVSPHVAIAPRPPVAPQQTDQKWMRRSGGLHALLKSMESGSESDSG